MKTLVMSWKCCFEGIYVREQVVFAANLDYCLLLNIVKNFSFLCLYFLFFLLDVPCPIRAKSYAILPIRIYLPHPILCFCGILSVNELHNYHSPSWLHYLSWLLACSIMDIPACSLKALSTETYTWQVLSQGSLPKLFMNHKAQV